MCPTHLCGQIHTPKVPKHFESCLGFGCSKGFALMYPLSQFLFWKLLNMQKRWRNDAMKSPLPFVGNSSIVNVLPSVLMHALSLSLSPPSPCLLSLFYFPSCLYCSLSVSSWCLNGGYICWLWVNTLYKDRLWVSPQVFSCACDPVLS